MNDPMKRLDTPKQRPNPPGNLGQPSLRADMPLWETPAYLKENSFPMPRETSQPDKGRAPQGGLDKKPPQSPQAKKPSSKKKKGSSRKPDGYSDTEADGYIRRSPIQSWFNTFMIMNIPIIGWLYLLILALGKKDQRKDFAKAYLVYKLVFLLLALVIIALCLHEGMKAADLLLQYIDML